MKKANCYIGKSGWSYKHWRGLFYPEKMSPGQYLEFYTTQFNCTELNASFYRLPTEKTVRAWNDIIPQNFRMEVKLSRQTTHFKRLKDSMARKILQPPDIPTRNCYSGQIRQLNG